MVILVFVVILGRDGNKNNLRTIEARIGQKLKNEPDKMYWFLQKKRVILSVYAPNVQLENSAKLQNFPGGACLSLNLPPPPPLLLDSRLRRSVLLLPDLLWTASASVRRSWTV